MLASLPTEMLVPTGDTAPATEQEDEHTAGIEAPRETLAMPGSDRRRGLFRTAAFRDYFEDWTET